MITYLTALETTPNQAFCSHANLKIINSVFALKQRHPDNSLKLLVRVCTDTQNS